MHSLLSLAAITYFSLSRTSLLVTVFLLIGIRATLKILLSMLGDGDCNGVNGGAHLLVALVLLETLEQGEESLERRPAKLKDKVDHSFGNRVFDILATAAYRQ